MRRGVAVKRVRQSGVTGAEYRKKFRRPAAKEKILHRGNDPVAARKAATAKRPRRTVAKRTAADVQHIYATNCRLAALKTDGSVVAWGLMCSTSTPPSADLQH